VWESIASSLALTMISFRARRAHRLLNGRENTRRFWPSAEKRTACSVKNRSQSGNWNARRRPQLKRGRLRDGSWRKSFKMQKIGQTKLEGQSKLEGTFSMSPSRFPALLIGRNSRNANRSPNQNHS